MPAPKLPPMRLMLLACALWLAGCASTSPPSLPPAPIRPMQLPPLPTEAMQPPAPAWCTPTCTQALKRRLTLRLTLRLPSTPPAPPFWPASASTP